MPKLVLIKREISIKDEVAAKDEITEQLTTANGWVLNDHWYSKLIEVWQMVTTEHKNGGPPTTDGTTLNDLTEALEKAVSVGYDLNKLAYAMNNGMYLSANAKAKPKKPSTKGAAKARFEAANAAFFASPDCDDPTIFKTYRQAVASGTVEDFILAWASSKGKI